jgi:dihydroflavonol-4-reductase
VAAVLCVALCKPFGINPPLYPRRLEFFTLDRSFSIEKAKRLLGYSPKVSVREGFERTGKWYAETGLLDGKGAGTGSV